MARLPGIDEAYGLVRGVLRGTVDTVRQARETVEVAHRVVLRADRVTAELQEPLLALAPGLRRLAVVLDDPVVDDVPDTVRRVREEVLPALRTVAQASSRVASVGGLVDEMTRVLPGAALLGRRPAPRVVVVPPVDPSER